MPNLKLRPQVRKQCYRFYDVRYLLVVFLFIIILALFSYFPQQNISSGHFKTRIHNDLPQKTTTSKELTLKDSYNLVTAISSGREFKWLLEFIHLLITQGDQFDITVWSLDLRDCEFNFLRNLKTAPVTIHVHHFPYHFYPLHIRSYHLTAIKPIVLESAAAAFGEVIWIEPNSKMPLLLDDIIQVVSDVGFVAASNSKPTSKGQCLTVAIGINYIHFKPFIENWLECAKKAACIAKTFDKSNMKPHADVDVLFEEHRRARKFSCVVMENKVESSSPEDSGVFTDWQRSKNYLCELHNACVLTGSHKTQGCLTPQLGRLRRNKMKYCSRHGYAYIEETFGFHKMAPCHRVWDKIHAILKYLGDCKLLFWVDTDAVFVDLDKTLESFIDAYPGKEFFVSWPRVDKTLNAGVLLVRNTPTIREFFLNVTSGKAWKENWCSRDKFEQAAINDQLNSGTMNGKYVIERDNLLQTLCSFYNKECIVSEKDFIAHFAPPNCPALNDLVQKFLDKNPQYI